MIATQLHNRIAPHSPPPVRELPALPTSARERGKIWSDTLFHSVLALKQLLTSDDPAIVLRAVELTFEMERTRLRHSKELAGSELVSDAQLQYEADQEEEEEACRARCAERDAAKAAEATQTPAEATEEEEEENPEFERATLHAREFHEAMEKSGKGMPEERSLRLTIGFLKKMGLKATDIPEGQYVRRLMASGVLQEMLATAPDGAAAPGTPST